MSLFPGSCLCVPLIATRARVCAREHVSMSINVHGAAEYRDSRERDGIIVYLCKKLAIFLCCSVLRCVAVCRSVLQVYYNVFDIVCALRTPERAR